MKNFFRYTLRTIGVDAARAFYAAVLGDAALDIVPLHEGAIARGARPHWLGFLDVGEVEPAAAEMVRLGGTAMGPKWVSPQGLEAAYLRDPGGALIALARPAPGASASGGEVVWHTLNTADVGRAQATYAELFGWAFQPPLDLGEVGVFHPFAWAEGGPTVGVMSDLAGRPGVHPHWLYHFGVAELDAAQAAVKASGGVVATTLTLPNGDRIAVCDDPQGAAFTLHPRR